MEKKAHRLTATEACRTFLADPVKGLSSGEAGARQKRDGFNEFEKMFTSYLLLQALLKNVVASQKKFQLSS